MNTTAFRIAFPAALAATLLLGGCKKDELPVVAPIEDTPVEEAAPPAPPTATGAISIASVDLGRTLDQSGMVLEPTAIFAPTDKIHASVIMTPNEPGATITGKLSARWTRDGHEVSALASKDFSFTGPGITTFTLEPTNPWLPGKYKVEIMLDNVQVATREFAIAR